MIGFTEWAVIQRYYQDVPQYNDKTILFKLMKDLSYTSKDGAYYVVPQGFVTDLGSIPRFFWNLISPRTYPSAYTLHDWLCRQGWISRKDTDKLLYEALILSNAKKWKAKIIYWAVRVFAIFERIK